VKGLVINYEELVKYFSKMVGDENDLVAKYCLKMLQSP
jgi:hypothetical protein